MASIMRIFAAVLLALLSSHMTLASDLRGSHLSPSPPRDDVRPCASCSSCIHVPDNPQAVTDEQCAQCAMDRQSWWPCTSSELCQCAATAPTPLPTAAPPTPAVPTTAPTPMPPTSAPTHAPPSPSPPPPAVKDNAWNQVDQDIYPDAKCLDGTPGAFYLNRSPSGSTKWVIYFQGGAWCPKDGEATYYQRDEDCSARAYSTKNSMHNSGRGTTRPCLPPACVTGNSPEMVHFQVRNEEQNPVAHDWNFVSVDYCDGGSFSGHATEYTASTYDAGQSVYMNGGDILTAVLATMKDEFDTADEVIITGGSAGGLAVAIHADYIANYFPDAAKKVVVPESGVFSIQYGWDDMMKQMFVSRNVETSKLNEGCVTANSGSEWQCFAYAWEALKHSKIPFYIMNSMYDSSQTAGEPYAEQQGALLWNKISSAVDESTTSAAGALVHACHDHTFSYEGNLLDDTTKLGFQYFQTWWSAVKSGANQKLVSAVPEDTPYKDSATDPVYCAGLAEYEKLR